ncbi:MAG: methionyl-tRNA formyltransferase, partial [Oscillospiraceae bacterium]|nr:methionyl-tRNA formyltransferase [Oscillospiraceae bacterium]
MKTIFMGTPDFAAKSLEALIENKYDVAAVFTKADKPVGRGMKTEFSPVKKLALENGIKIYQPVKLRDEAIYDAIREIAPDVIVVVAYGKIIPPEILEIPKYGCINVHGSLLPRYRGAAPIQWSVINGDRITGVTTMYLSEGMDEGDMILKEETEIGEFETAGELFDRLTAMGADLLIRTLRLIENGTAPRIPQDHSAATYVKQLDKSLCPIDFTKAPRACIKQIYGLQPWPVATMELGGQTVKVFHADYSPGHTDADPGTIVSADNTGIGVACKDGKILLITELQAPGKKR